MLRATGFSGFPLRVGELLVGLRGIEGKIGQCTETLILLEVVVRRADDGVRAAFAREGQRPQRKDSSGVLVSKHEQEKNNGHIQRHPDVEERVYVCLDFQEVNQK